MLNLHNFRTCLMKHRHIDNPNDDKKPHPQQSEGVILRMVDGSINDPRWGIVESLFSNSEYPCPASGFSVRWWDEKIQRKKRLERKQNLAMLLGSGLIAGLLFILGGLGTLAQLLDPGDFLVKASRSSLEWSSSLVWYYQAIQKSISPLRTAPQIVIFFGFFAVLGLTAIVWLKLFRKMAYYQGRYEWA